jgi:hypothetical protein
MRKASIFDKVLEFANEFLSDNFGFLLVPLPVVSRPVTMSASNNKSRKAAVIQSNKASSSKTGPPQTFQQHLVILRDSVFFMPFS